MPGKSKQTKNGFSHGILVIIVHYPEQPSCILIYYNCYRALGKITLNLFALTQPVKKYFVDVNPGLVKEEKVGHARRQNCHLRGGLVRRLSARQKILNQFNIPYHWVNIDRDEIGEEFVLKVNKGMRSIPTIVFEDGSILVEPSNLKLGQKLGITIEQ